MSKTTYGRGEEAFHKALALYSKRQLSAARDVLLPEADTPKPLAEALQLLGAICGELGLNDEALRHLRKAVSMAPRSASAHFNLGTVALMTAHYEEALASFGAALALKPNTAQFLAACGDALGKMGRYDEAVAQYGRAIAAAPDQPHAHENLGRIHLQA